MSRIKYAMDAITSFSYKPLRLSFGLAGFAISVAVILALCTVFSKKRRSILWDTAWPPRSFWWEVFCFCAWASLANIWDESTTRCAAGHSRSLTRFTTLPN